MTDKKRALVLQFSRPMAKTKGMSDFRKGLVAVAILREMSANLALLTLEYWLEVGLISIDEKSALLDFWGIQ